MTQDPADGSVPSAFKIGVRILLGVGALVVLVGLSSALFFFVSNAGGLARIVISVLVASLLAWFGVGYFRQFAHPPAPDPEPLDVDPRLRLAYVCEMCGLELAVVKAAKEKAPRHCGEEMILLRRGS